MHHVIEFKFTVRTLKISGMCTVDNCHAILVREIIPGTDVTVEHPKNIWTYL